MGRGREEGFSFGDLFDLFCALGSVTGLGWIGPISLYRYGKEINDAA